MRLHAVNNALLSLGFSALGSSFVLVHMNERRKCKWSQWVRNNQPSPSRLMQQAFVESKSNTIHGLHLLMFDRLVTMAVVSESSKEALLLLEIRGHYLPLLQVIKCTSWESDWHPVYRLVTTTTPPTTPRFQHPIIATAT